MIIKQCNNIRTLKCYATPVAPKYGFVKCEIKKRKNVIRESISGAGQIITTKILSCCYSLSLGCVLVSFELRFF